MMHISKVIRERAYPSMMLIFVTSLIKNDYINTITSGATEDKCIYSNILRISIILSSTEINYAYSQYIF